jgi:hypothetical protein
MSPTAPASSDFQKILNQRNFSGRQYAMKLHFRQMISPLTINKALRQHLALVLLKNGFDLVKARKAWGWHPSCIYVLEVENVGNAFAKATGWPMHSLQVTVGVWMKSGAENSSALFRDEQGRLRPDITACQHQLQLLDDKSEQAHIWRVEDDGSNLNTVVRNIAEAFLSQAAMWLASVESEQSGVVKN